jgi:chromosome segregation ATPase
MMAGCESTPAGCDPSKADFFKNTACLAGGGYAARQARLRRELARERQLNREFHDVYAALQDEQTALHSRRQHADLRYGKLDRAWQHLQDELHQVHGENLVLRRRIDEIDRQIRDRKHLGGDDEDLAARERERADLQRKLDLLQRELETGIYN